MLAEKGYQFATVTPEIKPLPGGPKLVNLTFHIDEGPQVKIRDVEFVGNKAIPATALKRQMKNNKGEVVVLLHHRARHLPGGEVRGGRRQGRRATTATSGYIAARVGEPELRYLEDSTDRRTRWVQLRIPVTEGERYRVGELDVRRTTRSSRPRGCGRCSS